ncbi:MAG: HAMP domain-containing protein [Flavobacteriales bacterium]|nr:HAMP domain-containing protein [Flavobacteriales bacterium]
MRRFLLFLSLTVAIGLAAGFFTGRKHSSDQQRSVLIEQEFQAVDIRLKNVLNQVAAQQDGLRTYCDRWQKHGIGLVIYDNGVATEWTTNAVPFPLSFEERTKPIDGLIKLKSAWYLCRKLEENGQLLVGYALVETEYGFENRYIQNQWNPDMPNADGFSITQIDHNTYPLHLEDGTVAAYLRQKTVANEPIFSESAALWLLFIALMLITIWASADWLSEFISKPLSLVVFLLLLIGFRSLMLWWSLPKGLYAIAAFGPTLHASSLLIPSLGDLALHMVFLLIALLRISRIEPRPTSSFLPVASLRITQVLFVFPLQALIRTLVFNSSFSLHLNNPFSLNGYSFVALIIIFLGLLCLYLALRITEGWIARPNRWMRDIILWSFGAAALFLLTGCNGNALVLGLTVLAMLISLALIAKWLNHEDGISGYVPMVLIFTVLATVMLVQTFHANEKEERKALARKLEERQNPITEYLFDGLEEKILSDRTLRNLLAVRPLDQEAVLAALHQLLAYDHWNQYVATVNLFNEKGGIMASDEPAVGPNYFELLRDFDRSKPTMAARLAYAGVWDAQGGYIARLELNGRRSQDDLVLFIRLVPERTDDILGFTDLFVDEEISTAKEFQGYSYAIYEDGELQDKYGDFAYSLSDARFREFKGENTFVEFEGYEHLVNRPLEGRVIVISKLKDGLIDHLTIFSYLFLFFFACATIAAMLEGRLLRGLFSDSSFRNRINLAMGSVLLFSLLLIGALTVFYVVRGYNNRNQEMISERSRSILIVLERRLSDRESFSEDDQVMVATLLNRLSKVFFTDINFYQLNGHLLATSRPRLYDEGLMAKVLDRTAYTEMRFNQRSSFIQDETIGNLKYLTAYMPFRNQKGDVIGFMSLPYFARQYGLQQEVFSLLAALTNIYVFLILLSVVLALVISNRITEPLRFIRDSLKNLKLDQTNRAIEWKSKDEIGELVDEYNRTLNELVRSAEMLARSERESAWREMAKQVAHEIKNPLTPMKLSIQMLQRSMNDGAEDLNERIERTAKTLIEQIDTLSHIATEFSSFAQMPKASVAEVNLKEVLRNAVQLHQNSDTRIELDMTTDGTCTVRADKEQLLRVFNNLIKNGIQAIPEGRDGEILVRLKHEGNECTVSVKDNGSGIPTEVQEKIFVPNFTTKTSGMGLGLAMVKNIIETANGRIWFETEQDAGTSFHVAFPVL